MKVIYIDAINVDPEQILEIDLSKNIILSTLEKNNIYLEENNKFYILNKSDIFFNNLKIIGNTTYIIDYNPHIKWSVPKNVELIFNEPCKKTPLFQQIFTNYLEIDNEPDFNKLLDISFCIYMDKERSRSIPKIPIRSKMLEVNRTFNMLGDYIDLDSLYVIKNDYIFFEFKKHFDR